MMEFSQHHHNLLVHADGRITATAESIKNDIIDNFFRSHLQ